MRDMPSRLTRRTVLGTGLGLAAALAAPALLHAHTPALETLSGRAFGTSWRLALPSGSRAEALRPAIEALLAGIDRQMSPWRADSDISRFNAAPAGAQRVPEETAHVAASALRLARQSGGHFDPTVGPLVARWGFGPIEGDGTPDWRALSAAPGEIAKARAGLTLDLCGIAKGHALDLMADVTANAGHNAFLIDLGGELLARGRHPSGRGWQVAVEDPRPGRTGAAAALRLDDGIAVATSGGRTQGYELDGRRYSHIIDPARGAPVAGGLASVTVLAATAMEADGWATALAAAGATDGPALARARGLAALFLIDEGTGLRREESSGIRRHLL